MNDTKTWRCSRCDRRAMTTSGKPPATWRPKKDPHLCATCWDLHLRIRKELNRGRRFRI